MKIYNSKTRQKEEFIPINNGVVNIYSCGPTVYNYFHIGNARPFIVFDVLRRYLEKLGYKVNFVQNFTDIDDKMIKRANEEGISVKELGDRFINEYFIDADALGIMRATKHPRATEHIGDMIKLIVKLINNGAAYQSGNDVYFSVKDFPNYGCLCGQNLDDLESGARIDIDSNKRNPLDFVLWKGHKEGEPSWNSPWGMGRPGWHLECSAMAIKYLGETIDIHCGGKDLLFPHHENETAQSEAATGKPFAHYWMHNGFININNEKMSKSAGNFFTIRDLSKKYDLEVIRMFMLLSHYRSPLNYSPELIDQASSSLDRLYNSISQLNILIDNSTSFDSETENNFKTAVEKLKGSFKDSMNDDLNTADAIAAMFDFAKYVFSLKENTISRNTLIYAKETMYDLADVLGILRKREESIPDQIQDLLDKRQEARLNKDFKLSDKLRNEIESLGFTVEDTKLGQKVKRK